MDPVKTPTTGPMPADPVPPEPAWAGRTPSKVPALRAGIVLGTGLLVVVGSAIAMAAAPRSSSGGADPRLAAASGSTAPEHHNGPKDPTGRGGGNGFGHGGFGELFGFGGGHPDKAGRRFGQVTITAIDGSSVALATDDGWTRTIQVTGSTTITRGGAAATAADLHVGDHVRFRQHRDDDGMFSITAVEIVLPKVFGTIESTADGSLTITDRDGATLTIHLGATTKIRVRGVDNATAKDLAKGQLVIVVGTRRADGSIDATGVLAGKLGELRPDKWKRDQPAAPGASSQPG